MLTLIAEIGHPYHAQIQDKPNRKSYYLLNGFQNLQKSISALILQSFMSMNKNNQSITMMKQDFKVTLSQMFTRTWPKGILHFQDLLDFQNSKQKTFMRGQGPFSRTTRYFIVMK